MPWPVVGHLTAPVDLMHLNAKLLEPVVVHKNVGSLASTPQGVDVRMFDQEKNIRDFAFGYTFVKALLQRPRLLVLENADINDVTVCHDLYFRVRLHRFQPSFDIRHEGSCLSAV